MSANVVAPLEVFDRNVQASYTFARDVPSSQIRLDCSRLEGATEYFEIMAAYGNSTTERYIQLYESTSAATLRTDTSNTGLMVPTGTGSSG
jgi:hypothetical protein